MKRWFALFGMSENERKGFLVLLFIILCLSLLPTVYRYYLKQITKSENFVHVSFVEQADRPSTASRNGQRYLKDERSNKYNHQQKKSRLFPFNPNDLPIEQWRELGFSDRQIQVIKNYEAKSGRFFSKADVAKIYSISNSDYQRIAPYIQIDEQRPTTHQNVTVKDKAFESKKALPLFVDINTADTAAFKALRGIGSVLASRIVKFRDGLGGFYHLDQVKEVYGISEELYNMIQPHLKLTDKQVKTLPINKLSMDELAKHPYVSKKQALHLVRYREQHGNFRSFSDLQEIHTLDADFLRKIAPYLNYN